MRVCCGNEPQQPGPPHVASPCCDAHCCAVPVSPTQEHKAEGSVERSFVARLLDDVDTATRVQGRTAYVAMGEGARSAAGEWE